MSSRPVARSGVQTPRRQTAEASPSKTTPVKEAVTDSPGNWRHPRLDEITNRRAATVFNETNLKTVLYNSIALGVVYVARTANGKTYQQLSKTVHSLVSAQHIGLFWLVLQLVLLVNIGRALLPLFRQPDDLADIPLTPSQRKLLGLTPLKGAPAPNAVYTTPPRYSRTPSRSGSPAPSTPGTTGNRRSFSGSPIASSPLFPKTRNGTATTAGALAATTGLSSPFSPGTPYQSPFQKGSSSNNNSGRRSSFGSPGALGSAGGGGGGLGAAPLFSESSPGSGKRLSVGLNNKWLYEKGRRSSSGAARIY